MDTLRTILVGWIIAGHALLGYSSVGGWAYDEVSETTFDPNVEMFLAATLGPTAIFLMGTFFLVSGLFTPGALESKGTRAFVRDRVLRLGVPFALSAIVIWPATMWIAYRASGQTVSYGFLLVGRDRLIDSGGLWFAEVLLIISLGYVVLRRLGRGTWTPAITIANLALLAATVTGATFFVRRWFSARGPEYLDLHIWQWPQLIAMFALGVIGARQHLARRVPEDVGRVAGWIALFAVVTGPLVAMALSVDNLQGDLTPFLSGWRLEALVFAAYEGVLVVFGSVWLLGFAQRKLATSSLFWKRMARSSFAAFILQGPVLILLAVMLRPVDAPAEVKAFIVLVTGVVSCFGLGWLLVTRTRVGRIV